MCGIVGLTGSKEALAQLRSSLATLEYRGYDSAGIAVADLDHPSIVRHRSAVRGQAIAELSSSSLAWPENIGAGIGHTRWATHGAPTHDNAHPHMDCSGSVAIVHNGIIENHRELSARLVDLGHTMSSQTDTEVIAHLLEDELAKGSRPMVALQVAVAQLRGDFALSAVFAADPDLILAARRTSPLIIGLTKSAGYVASDISALLPVTRELYALGDGEIAEIRPGSLTVFDFAGSAVASTPIEVTWDVSAAEKGGYDDFMTKEIFEQPRALAETLIGRFRDDYSTDFEELNLGSKELSSFSRVIYLACGSSYHAALSASLSTEQFREDTGLGRGGE